MRMNSGYLGWSMSRRAAAAYDDGLAPLSKIGGGKYARAAALWIGASEWHHTSKFCNRTEFYYVPAAHHLGRQLKATGLKPTEAVATLDAKRRDRERRYSSPYAPLAYINERRAKAAEYLSKAADYGDRPFAKWDGETTYRLYYEGLAAEACADAKNMIRRRIEMLRSRS